MKQHWLLKLIERIECFLSNFKECVPIRTAALTYRVFSILPRDRFNSQAPGFCTNHAGPLPLASNMLSHNDQVLEDP